MKIVEIETFRPAFQKNLCYVRVRTKEGVTGLGEAFYGSEAVDAYIRESAAPVILGLEDVSPERAARELSPYVGYQGGGAETRANGAIDIALWDALARSAGLPLYRLLGGPTRDEIPIYNTCAGTRYIADASRQTSSNWGTGADSGSRYEDLTAFMERPGELARELLGEGITGMKVWPFDFAAERTGGTDITSREIENGIGVVEAIREAVGLEMKLMIELHGLWNRKAATAIANALAPFSPYWVEDPMRADLRDALPALKRDVDVPIALGETATGRQGFLPLLQSGAIDVVTMDIGWTGGITEARKIASLADSFAVPVAPHDCTGPVALAVSSQLLFSVTNGLVQETVRAFYRTWYADIAETLPVIDGPALRREENPGHGVELSQDFTGRGDVISRSYRAE